jgi:protein scribble
MLTFQTDIDEKTGEQVLTCFLLPQMEYQAEPSGNSKRIEKKRPSRA